MKYYVFTFTDRRGGGRHFLLAPNEADAMKRLRQFLNRHHPFRHFTVHLEQVLPA